MEESHYSNMIKKLDETQQQIIKQYPEIFSNLTHIEMVKHQTALGPEKMIKQFQATAISEKKNLQTNYLSHFLL